jgi:hypothetical protein
LDIGRWLGKCALEFDLRRMAVARAAKVWGFPLAWPIGMGDRAPRWAAIKNGENLPFLGCQIGVLEG